MVIELFKLLLRESTLLLLLSLLINLYNDIVTYTEQRWEGIPIMVYFLILRSLILFKGLMTNTHLQILQTQKIYEDLSQCPKIILYICTIKKINFLRNSSEGHFRTPSLSWYSFSDPQMTRVARLCIDSILLMCFTKYGFQTWQRNHIPKLDALRTYMLSRLLKNCLDQRFQSDCRI